MKKTILSLFTSLLLIQAYAQSKDKGIAVSIGVNMPVGEFSSTHGFGIAVDCSPSRHKFQMKQKNKKIILAKTAFTYNGGMTYYFGKSETVSGYPYKYPGYFFIHAFGGLLYVPAKKMTASLLAGPALGIYNGNTRFNIGARLEGNYKIKTNISAGPLLNMMLEPGTNALWSAGMKFTLEL
jgi:hypothetical protein